MVQIMDLSFDSSLLFLTLTQSRQAWTNTIFKRYMPSAPSESGSANSTSSSSSLPPTFRVVGERVTLIIGPHIFRDTRFLASWTSPSKEAPSTLVILFEFRETAGTFWYFPSAAVVEKLNFAPPFEVIASFRLPSGIFDGIHSTNGASGASSHSPSSSFASTSSKSTSYQGLLTMQMLNVGKELYQFIQAYTKDPLQTFGDFFSKFKGTSASWPSNFSLQPCRQPSGLTEAIFASKRPKRKDLPSERSLQGNAPLSAPSASASHSSHGIASSSSSKKPQNPKKKTSSHHQASSAGPSAKGSSTSNAAAAALYDSMIMPAGLDEMENASNSHSHPHNSSSSSSSPTNRKCAYCGAKSTPMWRRGPDGAGTLCNACGVKWKNGKISFSGALSSQLSPKPPSPSSQVISATTIHASKKKTPVLHSETTPEIPDSEIDVAGDIDTPAVQMPSEEPQALQTHSDGPLGPIEVPPAEEEMLREEEEEESAPLKKRRS